MNNLRKTAVLLFIGVFIISMALVPFTPMANVESQVAAPTDYEREFVEKWAQRLQDDFTAEKVDPVITSYIETGILDESVVTTRSGDTKLLLYLPPTFDTATLATIAKVRWQIDLKLVRVASVDVNSISALKQLTAMDEIQYIQADYFLEPMPSVDMAQDFEPDIFAIKDMVGATGTFATDYNGTGIVAGVVDSGVDFSQQDMWDAEYNNGTYPMSYDPSSYGITEMVIANRTVVANPTTWLAAGNLLTYEMGGKYYLNTSGWDPVCHNEGFGGRNLMGLLPPFDDGYGPTVNPGGTVVGFIGLYEDAWGPVNNVSEFVYHEMWKDWEIPAPGADNYTFGWAFQQKIDGYAKVFAPSMIYNGDLVIDWNGTLAWTRMWNWAIRAAISSAYAQIDLNTTADRDLITGMMDWSFVDDIDEGYVFNKDNSILMADVDDDMSIDCSLGSLSWAWDSLGWLTNDPGLFFGITDDGLGWNALFTSTSDHGHWTAATIASAGTYGHDVYENGTLYYLPGIAPGAKIIASKGVSAGGDLASNVWCMGFTLNETSGYWEYIDDGLEHQADLVSNSWGWGPGGMYLQLRYFNLVYDLASVPGILAPTYPGILFVFSAGNEGVDYGTAGTPGSAFSVISVGATMANHMYVDDYGPYQPNYQQAVFSSTGPAYTGYVKPDIMAPGFFGFSPEPSENDWLQAGDTYLWWSGTSLSCPVVAGVAALVMEAAGDNDPQMIKNVLLSTADDMGYDPMVQGHGFVNAEAACEAVETGIVDEYIFESESFAAFADQTAESYAYWAPYWAPFDDIYYGALFDPIGLETSSMFFGTLDRSGSREITMNIEDYGGTSANMADFDIIQPWYYTELDKVEFSLTGYTYNDTLNNVISDGYFNLYDNMTAGEQSDFLDANYATMTITMDAADSIGSARLFDWNDSYGGPELNMWNGTHGDYLVYVQRSEGPNILTMRLASPGTLADLFMYNPTLILFGGAGVTVDVTIQIWEKTFDGDVVITNDGTTGVNATLTVDADAEYGVHIGSIYFEDTSSGFSHEVPYSYTVEMNLDAAAAGDVMTLVDNSMDLETTPYDTATAVTYFIPGTESTQEGGGFTTFHIEIPYNAAIDATVLIMRANWTNPGTVIDFAIRTELGSTTGMATTNDGGRPFNPQPTGDRTNTIVWDPGYLINGTYWFEYNVHVFDGADVPEEITIVFQLYGDADMTTAAEDFTWTSRTMTTPTTINDDDVLVGDHVVIENTWSIPDVAGLPEYSVITATRLAFLSGLYLEIEGIYADPQGTDAWPIPLAADPSLWVWVTEGNLGEPLAVSTGDSVYVELDAQHDADPSFDVYYWEDANADNLVTIDEITSGAQLSVDNGGGGAVEFDTFVAPSDGVLAIRAFCWDWAYPGPGSEFVLTVDSRVSQDIDSEAGTPTFTTYDTYNHERNNSYTVYLTCWTETDVVWIVEYSLRFENFFTPIIAVNPVIDLGDDTFNFTWAASDSNADDSLYYSVWISSDGGTSFQLIAANLTVTTYIWDSDGFLIDDYAYRIRVHDCDHTYPRGVGAASAPPTSYWPGLFSDDVSALFEAGNVVYTPPVTTTTTTTTTTPPPPPPGGPDPLLIGLLGGIGVGVVILLILFLIRKR